jgi:hypothetical protein
MAMKLGEDAVTQDDLVSSEKAAQDTYLLYVRKQEEARMDDALDQRGIVNVAICGATRRSCASNVVRMDRIRHWSSRCRSGGYDRGIRG